MTTAADRSPDTAAGLEETYTEADVHQEFGENPNEVRDTNHYQEEYVKGFVDKWDDYIGWEGRAASEGSFFIDQLSARGVEKVLDVATGTGFNSVQLLKGVSRRSRPTAARRCSPRRSRTVASTDTCSAWSRPTGAG